MASKETDIAAFATSQLDLLDKELQAELTESTTLTSQASPTALQRAGAAILNLQLSSQRTGYGGKTVVELELDPAVTATTNELPEHGIRTGDIVGVQEQPKGDARKKEKTEITKKGVEGVVTRVTSTAVHVALDKDEVDVPGGKLWLWVNSTIKAVSRGEHKADVRFMYIV